MLDMANNYKLSQHLIATHSPSLLEIEFVDPLRGRQRLRRRNPQRYFACVAFTQGAFTAIRRSSPAFGAGDAPRSLLNGRNCAASRLKNT